ncbi:helix-turn-helix domain-containing protein [Sulfurimonas sp. CS5]|uniref:helix-turn-helix domain-containing protein n=1 Tax=Sulfurimonas sp. CS5 TaxID=3391145 RepID=UPI0039E95350
MLLKPIKDEKAYDKALDRVDELMELNPKLGTSQSDELEVLAMLVEKYEEQEWTIFEPDPIEAIKVRMEQMHLKQKDLIPYIGNKSKVSEVLNRKVGLSLSMITNIAAGLHLPLESLIQLPKKNIA